MVVNENDNDGIDTDATEILEEPGIFTAQLLKISRPRPVSSAPPILEQKKFHVNCAN